MLLLSPLALAAPLLFGALPTARATLGLDSLEYIPICNQIAEAISDASDVYFRRAYISILFRQFACTY